jgi:hypothetical protein
MVRNLLFWKISVGAGVGGADVFAVVVVTGVLLFPAGTVTLF